jgi:two-component system, OmpR family, sensor kinase
MSLRLRLTIIYTCLLGMSLLAFSSVLYIVLQNSLMGAVDRTLLTSSADIENRYIHTVTDTTFLGQPFVVVELPPIREFTTPGIYFQILNAQGRPVAHSSNLGNEVIPINPDVVQSTLDGQTSLTTSSPGRPAEPLRVLSKPLVLNHITFGVLQVGASLYSVRLTMRLMLLLLIFGVVVTMLLGAMIIWFVTRRALQPLSTIAGTAEYIRSSQDLSQRLLIRTPDDEVGRLARAFNAMIERLEAAFATQKQFIADSSHELRTPLTVIRGNLDLMKRDPQPESQVESLAAIETEAQRMSRLVDELMLLAQLDGAQPPVRRPVALDEVVFQVYNQTRVLAVGRNVTLGHVDGARVMADNDRLVQMLLNLVDNAIKYTPEGGVITLECHAPAEPPAEARLSVHDTGIGIAAEDIPHLFDRFYRVDQGRARSRGGTGLGLAIVKSIAESYGGTVSVQSELGKGSTFTISLPLT